MSVSKTQQAANRRYDAKNYDRVVFRVKIGGKDALQAYAARHDASANAFIIRAIRQALQDDGADAETIRAICGDSSGR